MPTCNQWQSLQALSSKFLHRGWCCIYLPDNLNNQAVRYFVILPPMISTLEWTKSPINTFPSLLCSWVALRISESLKPLWNPCCVFSHMCPREDQVGTQDLLDSPKCIELATSKEHIGFKSCTASIKDKEKQTISTAMETGKTLCQRLQRCWQRQFFNITNTVLIVIIYY